MSAASTEWLHIQGDGALVVDGNIGRKREIIAGLEVDNGCAGTRGASHVTTQIVGREAGHRRVLVGVLADVLVHGELLGPEAELLEDVVARDIGHAQSEGGEEGGELHGYGWGRFLA